MAGHNGSKQDYAELVIETCFGDTKQVVFDEPSFRESRAKANKLLAQMAMIGLGGKDMSWYQTDPNLEEYLGDFPVLSHIVRVQVNKLNHQSDVVKPFAERHYECAHTKESA